MDQKEHILNEIKRTAEKNGGMPLGKKRFSDVTGIKFSDWYGKGWNDWNSWGDALKEAGYAPNSLQEAYNEIELIEHLINLTRKLGCFPVEAERRREASRNKKFPSHNVFHSRLGAKSQTVKKVVDFCNNAPEQYEDILKIYMPLSAKEPIEDQEESDEKIDDGFCYLMKSGKYYKIGCTNAIDRRQYEIGIQLPEKIEAVHSIRTDDPSGIEAYWHNRFKSKRLNGEWFNLTAADVRIFKKRKFM